MISIKKLAASEEAREGLLHTTEKMIANLEKQITNLQELRKITLLVSIDPQFFYDTADAKHVHVFRCKTRSAFRTWKNWELVLRARHPDTGDLLQEVTHPLSSVPIDLWPEEPAQSFKKYERHELNRRK